MNKLKHKIFNECYLGKYKIYSVIPQTSIEFDIVLEEPNEHIYYYFIFFYKDGELDDEFRIYRYYNKLYGDNLEKMDVEATRGIVGNDVFDSVCNLSTFLLKMVL